MRKLVCCLVLFLGLPATGQAQNTSEPKAWAEQFLNTIVEDGPTQAHRLLLNNSQLGEQRPDAIRGIRENMQKAEDLYGKATGYEFLTEKRWGESILIFIAIVKRKETPIFWKLVFYRYESNWNLVNFAIIDKFDNVNSLPLF